MRLAGKVAIITGSGSGMGLAAARLFAREGAAVVVAERSPETGAAAAAEISRDGGRALFVRTDVRRAADVTAMVRAALDAFGAIDVLYNNAGVEVAEGDDGPADEALWDLMFETNPKGTWLCCRAALPHLLERRGVILNTASVTGMFGVAGHPAYAASKAAVVNLTRSLALAYAERGVRINVICPGPILTPTMLADWDLAPTRDEGRRRTLATTPANRLAEPEEVARLALFLVSDDASFISGAVIPIDGAKTAGLMPLDRYRMG